MSEFESDRFDLFISYASRDEVTHIGGSRVHIVSELKRMLENHRHPKDGRRFRVCTYREDFELTADLPEMIRTRLRNSSHLLVLCSDFAVKSKWVKRELWEFKEFHGRRKILSALFSLEPEEAFPDYFAREQLSANLSFNKDTSASDWLAQTLMESHKLVAKVWQVELRAVHDRFEEARRQSEQLDLEARAALSECLAQEEGRESEALVRAVESASLSILRELDPPSRVFEALGASIAAIRPIRLEKQTRSYYAALFTPDGNHVLTGGEQAAYLWNSQDGHLIKTLSLNARFIESIDVSPDGTRCVIGGTDGAAALWTIPEGRLLQPLNHGGSESVRVRFSLDGAWVLTLTQGVCIWSAENGKLLKSFNKPSHKDQVRNAVSPDGHRYVSWESKRHALVWDIFKETLLATLTEDEDCVFEPVFSPDGSILCVDRHNGTGSLWNVETGTRLALLKGGSLNRATFSEDGNLLAIPEGFDKTCRILNVHNGKYIKTLSGHEDFVHSASFSPAGDLVVTASSDRSARLWRYTDGNFLAILPHRYTIHHALISYNNERILTTSREGIVTLWPKEVAAARAVLEVGSAISCIAWAPNADYFVAGDEDGRLHFWTSADGRSELTPTGHDKTVTALAISPDAQKVCSVAKDGLAIMWSMEHMEEILRVDVGTNQALTGVAFSADGSQVLTWGTQGTAWLWNPTTGTMLDVLDGHDGAINSASLSRDGQRAVTGAGETAILWNLENRTQVTRLDGHDGWVWTTAFSPDSSRVVTGARDRKCRSIGVWDGRSGEQIAMPEDQGKWVRQVVFAPDGTLFASGGVDHTVRLWNTHNCKLIATFRGHDHNVEALDFSADGLRLASGGEDGTVRLWDITTRQPLAVFRGHASPVVALAYSPDGEWIASVDRNGRLLLYPGSLRTLLSLAFQVLQGRSEFDQVRHLFEDLSDIKELIVTGFGAQGVGR